MLNIHVVYFSTGSLIFYYPPQSLAVIAQYYYIELSENIIFVISRAVVKKKNRMC